MKKWICIFSSCLVLLLAGCTGSQINSSDPLAVAPSATYAVLPFDNHTETPLAGERATSVAAGLLDSYGIRNVLVYRKAVTSKTLFPGISKPVSRQAMLAWARQHGARYAITGSVNEWTYKVGLDGEPVAGFTVELLDAASGKILWTSVGSASGGSRKAVSTVAQRLMNKMMSGLFGTSG